MKVLYLSSCYPVSQLWIVNTAAACRTLHAAGVTCVYCPEGVTTEAWTAGIEALRSVNRRASRFFLFAIAPNLRMTKLSLYWEYVPPNRRKSNSQT